MSSKRYTVVIADSSTGSVRRFPVSRRAVLAAAAVVLSLPLLFGYAARWSASIELSHLRAGTATLRLENQSYRAATVQLTDQISALQAVVDELGDSAKLDAATAAAIAKLPYTVRKRAMGGQSVSSDATRTLLAAAVTSPENTFGVLRDLLGALESRLQFVRTGVERQQALSRATPSIWPALGWLTGGFGRRADPFTGERAQHQGLDIAGERGQPVYATADGIVETASWTGDFGNLVVLSHDFGLTTRYAHLSRFNVTPGQAVRRGDVIGYIGATGRASGTHLHYEVWANGRPINPLGLLTASPRP